MGVEGGKGVFLAVSCPQETLQRKREETSSSLSVSDPTVTLILALETSAFHLSLYLLNPILVSQLPTPFVPCR